MLAAFAVSAGCSLDPKVLRYPRQTAKVYVVKRGNTLSGIAKKYGVTVFALKKQNRLSSSKISVGQRIIIPTKVSPKTHAALSRRSLDVLAPYLSPKKYKAPSSIRKSGGKKKTFAPPKKAPRIRVKLHWPLKNPKVTSRFGTRQSGKHDGIDIGAPRGTKIYASAAGEVLFNGWGPTGYGRVILLKHSENVYTVYAHNHKNLVKKGRRVKKGEVIAMVGKTGRAKGNHLHFEVRVNRVAYDPLAYLPKLK